MISQRAIEEGIQARREATTREAKWDALLKVAAQHKVDPYRLFAKVVEAELKERE